MILNHYDYKQSLLQSNTAKKTYAGVYAPKFVMLDIIKGPSYNSCYTISGEIFSLLVTILSHIKRYKELSSLSDYDEFVTE